MKAAVLSAVDEFDRVYLVIGEGNHDCQKIEITPSLADKLEFELATIRMSRRVISEGMKT